MSTTLSVRSRTNSVEPNRSRTVIALFTLALLLAPPFFGAPLAGQVINPLVNGDFADPTGAPWSFVNQSYSGSVSYADSQATITGGNDGSSPYTGTYLTQELVLTGTVRKLSFDWWYESQDPNPGYDGLFYDIVDLDTGWSFVGGPLFLTSTSGESGHVGDVTLSFGNYELQLGTWSLDNLFGPGIGTFDNVTFETLDPFLRRGDCNTDGGLSLADAGAVIGYLFISGLPISSLDCADACDANDDGDLNIQDAIAILGALFLQPVVPLPEPETCGQDETPDPIGCVDFLPCP